MPDTDQRLEAIEQRLAAIEIKLGITQAPQAEGQAAERAAPTIAAAAGSPPVSRRSVEPVAATQLMAWAAGFALLLAAVYFLKLVYDFGWLTPERQIILASLAGGGLMIAGIFFSRIDRDYAAYLPALGLIIWYLSAYAAHLYYHLCSSEVAIAAISAITLVGIWLGRRFDRSVYAMLAAVGVYLGPLFMTIATHRLLDVVIFYTAWSLLFSFCALSEGRRITYVLPMFLALIGFDLIWRDAGESNWLMAAIYQLIQFTVFASTAAAFSVIHKRPLSEADGVVHGLAMLYFYGLEYLVLDRHAPEWAPTVGLLSAALVFLAYLLARAALRSTQNLGVGAVIVSSYCSIVIAHAFFFRMLPHAWFPWAALITTIGVGVLYSRESVRREAAFKPVLIVAGLIFGASYLVLLIGGGLITDIALPDTALVLYALMLYIAYYWFSRSVGGARAAPIALYTAHVAFMECALRFASTGLTASTTWAVFAVLVLTVAIWSKDKLLGQSALLIFCASGLKVLLHDLARSGSLVRVLTLIVLAVSLYVGGWLYQSLVRGIGSYHPDPVINRQINAIRAMLVEGLTPSQIAGKLIERDYPYLGEGSWTEERVAQIVRDYALGTT